MTREENLHWIDQEIQTWENECQSKHPIKEALYAARKALEQEPCEDAVSRKSVITIIQNHWWNCRDIDKLVNELPPVTPQESRWIPVTERLPEEMFGCLVTVWDANPKTGEEFENILPEFVGYDGETWNGADGKPIAFEVVAWMPLPEPYKGGE